MHKGLRRIGRNHNTASAGRRRATGSSECASLRSERGFLFLGARCTGDGVVFAAAGMDAEDTVVVASSPQSPVSGHRAQVAVAKRAPAMPFVAPAESRWLAGEVFF